MNTLIGMRRIVSRTLLPLALLAGGSLGYIQQSAAAGLDGTQEVPPVMTVAMGSVDIMIRPDHSVSGSINFSGMNATMAHIHLGAVGKNGPVIIGLTKTTDSTFVVPTGAMLNDSQYDSYLAGNLYVNVHSVAHPGGEIRAQLMPPAQTGY